MRGLLSVEVQNNQLHVLLNRAKLNLTPAQLIQLGEAIRDSALRVQARAVRNVTGYPVQYEGKAFRVRVRTGALRGAIDMQWPYQSPLQARVFVNGTHSAQPMVLGDVMVKPRPVSDYAAAIEYGHKAIDLKLTMQGKVVPFFAARSKGATGPYAAVGLSPVHAAGADLWESKTLNTRLASQGKSPMHFQRRKATAYKGASKGAGTYYIAFRRVGKTGWIIPAAEARPFMRAALLQSQDDTRRLTYAQLRQILNPAVP